MIKHLDFAKTVLMGFIALIVIVPVSFAGKVSAGATKTTADSKLAEKGFYKNIEGASKATLDVEGMSCSGCIFTIKSSLSKVDGIKEILVDVAAGKAEIYYDDKTLKSVDQVATAITASGYPAKITKIETAEQVKKNLEGMANRSRLYIASVGKVDIPRKDFDSELAFAKKRYAKNYGKDLFSTDKGKALLKRLKGQIVSRLINEGIQLQEIGKAGFKIDKSVVNKELNTFLNKKNMKLEKFKTALKDDGYSFDKFMIRFETRVLVNAYLDSRVFPGSANDMEKQQLYANWFNNAKLLAKVVYYDKDLENLARNQSSGCGTSCSK
jgi:copper chaperone CopZ